MGRAERVPEPMIRAIVRLDELPGDEARAALVACCGSERWASTMEQARPFGSAEAAFEQAERAFDVLAPADWQQAFVRHARIGDLDGAGERGRGEQAGVAGAGAAQQRALREGNAAYEARFGHVLLVCATGRGAGEMLATLQRRLANAPDVELVTAAEEQRKITRLRLQDLV